MKTKITILIVSATVVASVVAANDDSRFGMFSNHGDGFNSATLVVDKGGYALFAGGVAGAIGEWKYDTNASTMTLNYFDSITSKDGSVVFKFNQTQRSYSVLSINDTHTNSVDAGGERLTLTFATNVIPEEVVSMFAKYPEEVKKERARAQYMQESKRLEAEKLAKEKPEYERLLQSIRENSKVVLTNEAFYSRDDTPAVRAFRDALDDKSIKFSDQTLAELLDKLPVDNWYRSQIFARPELSSGTIEMFYPKALEWGAHVTGTILVNLVNNTNTPKWIVEDLAGRTNLAVWVTGPAQMQLKKYKAAQTNNSGTNIILKPASTKSGS